MAKRYDQNAEARAAAKFATVLKRNKDGQPTAVLMPGHEGAQYQVLVNRLEVGGGYAVMCECLRDGGPLGLQSCAGASHAVCYHIRAAIIKVAQESGYLVKFSSHRSAIERLLNFGGTLAVLYSRRWLDGKPLYVYMRQLDKSQEAAA